MAPTLFASAILALRKPANKRDHYMKSVKAPLGKTEPQLKDVYAAVKKVWGMGRGDSIEALICDTSTRLVGDAGIATGDPFGTAEFACGGVAKAFKDAIANAGAGANPFPPDGANNRPTPGRVRANALARAIKALPTPEKERIWRRARMYQTYTA